MKRIRPSPLVDGLEVVTTEENPIPLPEDLHNPIFQGARILHFIYSYIAIAVSPTLANSRILEEAMNTCNEVHKVHTVHIPQGLIIRS